MSRTFFVHERPVEGILLGSPVYFTDVTPSTKVLIERSGIVSIANGGLFKRKVALQWWP